MNYNEEWQSLYDNIRGADWPECKNLQGLVNLPTSILVEIIEHLARSKKTLPRLDIVGSGYPELLINIDSLYELLGRDNCKLSVADVLSLYSIVYSLKPKNVLEIGRHAGFSTMIIAGALIDSGNVPNIVSLDLVDLVPDSVKKMLAYSTTLLVGDCEFILDDSRIIKTDYDLFYLDADRSINYRDDFLNLLTISKDQSYFLFHNTNYTDTFTAITAVVNENKNLQYHGIFGDTLGFISKKC